jgi:flagellar biogenesis protein FliO
MFLVPVVIYLVVIGFVIWLVIRLVKSNERIADNTDRIARAISDRNQIEREKIES